MEISRAELLSLELGRNEGIQGRWQARNTESFPSRIACSTHRRESALNGTMLLYCELNYFSFENMIRIKLLRTGVEESGNKSNPAQNYQAEVK